MVINWWNPVWSGPDEVKLDAALAELESLEVIELAQRESLRHAHWSSPAADGLEA